MSIRDFINEYCESVTLNGVEIQKNGIIRDDQGHIIGRADDAWLRYNWQMIATGECPCCGRKVDGDDGD